MITEKDMAAQDKRLTDGIASVSARVDAMKSDRSASKHYAAALYAIANECPDMPVEKRAALADAVNRVQLERGLVDRDW